MGPGLSYGFNLVYSSEVWDYIPVPLPNGEEGLVAAPLGNTKPSGLALRLRRDDPGQGYARQRLDAHSIGSHTTWFEEPDLIALRLSGDGSVADSEILAREHLDMAQGSGTPAGRVVTSEALHRMPLRGVVVCRARLTSRDMAKLVFAGVDRRG